MRLPGVDDQSPPVIMLKEETGVGLPVALDADLDECLGRDLRGADEILDDPVLTPLREDPELGVCQRVDGTITGDGGGLGADAHAEVVDFVVEPVERATRHRSNSPSGESSRQLKHRLTLARTVAWRDHGGLRVAVASKSASAADHTTGR